VLSIIIAIKLYEGKLVRKLVNIIILVILMSACESIGIALLHFIYQISDINITTEKMQTFFEMTFSQVIVVFISHIVIIRIFKSKKLNNLTARQYLMTFVYAVFSVVNIYSLSILMKNINTNGEIICVMITIAGIVVTNTYFLNILEYESENNRLVYENQLFIQQSRMQYLYYDNLENQYRESLSIIHDVKRHMRAIEELYEQRENETAVEYAVTISSILEDFKLNEYTSNRVLNIILNDKSKAAEQSNIEFICQIDDVDLSFIDNIDLTTIFANLLDNALEACQGKRGDNFIQVQVGSFHNLVVINIKNTMEDKENKSQGNDIYFTNSHIDSHIEIKRNHSGIGLPNVTKVVKKYNGDFNIDKDGQIFTSTIVLSKQGRDIII
jgi:signal transduction histidine kinase